MRCRTGIAKLLFLSPSCIYHLSTSRATPDAGKLPIDRPAGVTNQWYASPRLPEFKLCQVYGQLASGMAAISYQ